MDFSDSSEQRMLRDSTRRLLEARSPVPRVRELADTAAGYDPEVWRQGAELGWPALGVPEEAGGLGQGLADLAIVAEEHGRALFPAPFVPTALVARALAASPTTAHRDDVLPGLLEGETTAAWAVAEPGRPWAAEGLAATARSASGGFVLDGVKRPVPAGATADWLLVTAVLDGTPALFLLPRDTPGLTLRPLRTLDITRTYAEVRLDGVTVDSSALVAHDTATVAALLDAGAVLTAADSVGVAQRVLAMTVDYVSVRIQFGRPIGSFQAVKHRCADMLQWAEGSRVATYYAAMALDAGLPDAHRAAGVAKAYTSEHVSRLVGEALQLHGGIGFTWEHDLHLYIRRAKVDEVLYGDPAHHQDQLCAQLVVEHGERTPA